MLLEACLQFVADHQQASLPLPACHERPLIHLCPPLQQNVEAAVRYLDLVEALFGWLVTQSQRRGGAYDERSLSGAPRLRTLPVC